MIFAASRSLSVETRCPRSLMTLTKKAQHLRRLLFWKIKHIFGRNRRSSTTNETQKFDVAPARHKVKSSVKGDTTSKDDERKARKLNFIYSSRGFNECENLQITMLKYIYID